MKKIEIDPDVFAAYCRAVAAMYTEVRAAQDEDVRQAVDRAMADGAELELTTATAAGGFTATIVTSDGRRTTIMEIALSPATGAGCWILDICTDSTKICNVTFRPL